MNILIMGASLPSMSMHEAGVVREMMSVQLTLMGVVHHRTVHTVQGVPSHAVLVLYKTDHERAMCYRLARLYRQPSVFVVESITIRDQQMYGVGGVEQAQPGDWPAYHGQHDDITIHLSPNAPISGDYVQLPMEMGALCMHFK